MHGSTLPGRGVAGRTPRGADAADVAALDERVRAAGLPSRSAAVQRAVPALTHQRLASDKARVFPSQVLLSAQDTGLHVDSEAQAERVRAVSVDALDGAWRLHLALERRRGSRTGREPSIHT